MGDQHANLSRIYVYVDPGLTQGGRGRMDSGAESGVDVRGCCDCEGHALLNVLDNSAKIPTHVTRREFGLRFCADDKMRDVFVSVT